jgi:hypothetical protein
MKKRKAYRAGYKAEPVQYTVRGVSPEVDRALRAEASASGVSLNEATVAALERATLHAGTQSVKYRDLSDLAGTWIEDKEFDKVIASQRRVDPRDWQ